jgi:hypothetical protein
MPEFRQTARPDEPDAPQGDWQAHWDLGAEPPPPRAPDLAAIIALLDALRAVVPRELQTQFTALVRELLMTLRALIDWYLERLDSPRREPRVEEIPID